MNPLPEAVCRRLKALPFGASDKELMVAIVDEAVVPELRLAARHRALRTLVVPEAVLEEMLARATWPDGPEQGYATRLPPGVELGPVTRPAPPSELEEAAINRFVDMIVSQALRNGAEELQILPGRVLGRYDGMLYEMMAPPLHVHPAAVERLRQLFGGQQWLRAHNTSIHGKFLSCDQGEIVLLEPAQKARLDDLDLPDAFRKALENKAGLILVEGDALHITFGAVLHHLEPRLPVGVASWSCAWAEIPVAFAPTGQDKLFRRLMRWDPAAVVIEELTDGADDVLGLAEKRLVVAGTNRDLPCLGRLTQRRERLSCESCRARGCDRCQMTGYRGWQLTGEWSEALSPAKSR